MNEGIHLDLDIWIVPGQIRKANLCRGLGNRYTPAGTEVLISAVARSLRSENLFTPYRMSTIRPQGHIRDTQSPWMDVMPCFEKDGGLADQLLDY